MHAESEGIGKGSTFTVRLPVCDQVVVRDTSQTPEDELSDLPAYRVLVVDDNSDAAEIETTAEIARRRQEIADDDAALLGAMPGIPSTAATSRHPAAYTSARTGR